jgi:TctA family transporter
MEESLRQALGISQGSFAILAASPISATLLLAIALSLAAPALRWAWRRIRSTASG